MALAYTRALLKISGEALGGEKGSGLDFHVVEAFAEEIKAVHALGVHLALVVGGGNIIRGATASREGLDRVSADYMGMLATVINALALQDALEALGQPTRVQLTTDGHHACLSAVDAAFAREIDLFIQHGSRPSGPNPMLSMVPWGDAKRLTQQQIADVEAYVMQLNGVSWTK